MFVHFLVPFWLTLGAGFSYDFNGFVEVFGCTFLKTIGTSLGSVGRERVAGESHVHAQEPMKQLSCLSKKIKIAIEVPIEIKKNLEHNNKVHKTTF